MLLYRDPDIDIIARCQVPADPTPSLNARISQHINIYETQLRPKFHPLLVGLHKYAVFR